MYRNKNPVNQAFWMILSCFRVSNLSFKIDIKSMHFVVGRWISDGVKNEKSPRKSEAFF